MKTKKSHNKKLLKRFLPYFKPYKKTLAFDLFCALLTTICELLLPLVVRYITNESMENLKALSIQTILVIGIAYMLLRIVDAAANYYMASVGHIMGSKIETDMRRDLFAHLQKLPFCFYDDIKVGQIMSRMTSDLFDVTEFAHHCPEEFFIAFIKIIGAFAILSSINIYLSLIIFSCIPLMIIFTAFFNKRMRRQFKRQREQIGEINADVEDNLLGIRVVKSFTKEEYEKEKFKGFNKTFLDIKRKSYHYMAGFQGTTRVFDGIMYILVVVIGAIFMKYSKIKPADYVAYLLYISTLLTSIRRIVEFTEQFQRGMTGIERFIEIMDQPIEKESNDSIDLNDIKGDIVFDDISFSYGEKNEMVLNNISFDIKANSTLAIVGPSGAGKTTIANLLPRFYPLNSGKITIDGKDISKIKLSSLRSKIGIVSQDVYMFCGSVYENIAFGVESATKEQIIDAAKKAGAHDFIMELPDGYDTYVGERGVKLSGGQKQRISIARVFLKNPPILILDEATSALDNQSEMLIQNSLNELSSGRTTLIIAHRLTTIKNADNIIYLDKDGIEEMGSHKELFEKKGKYFKLYSLYSG